MLTALKTERSDTIEIFFHSSIVKSTFPQQFFWFRLQKCSESQCQASQTQSGKVTQLCCSTSTLYRATVAIRNISSSLQHAGLSQSDFTPFLNPDIRNMSRSCNALLQLEHQLQKDGMLLRVGKEAARKAEKCLRSCGAT